MPHKRNDQKAKRARRERALARWEENQDRGYRGYSFDPGSHIHPSRFSREVSRKSDPEYVKDQINILSDRV